MRDYIDAEKFLNDCQHGFITKRSTVTHFLACDVKLADILNFSHSADLFMLDFARAFDKVDYNIILKSCTMLVFKVTDLIGFLILRAT